MNKEQDDIELWGVLPAAGVGARMGLEFPKQYIKLAGKTILEHSANVLLAQSGLQGLTVCLSSEDNYFADLQFDHPKLHTTIGGDTRATSVRNGLLALRGQAKAKDWVLVHDAARPCLSSLVLARLVELLWSDDVGGILAVKSKDTLKQSRIMRADSLLASIDKTVDRSLIWQAQTPQMFRYGLLLDALAYCAENDLNVTDEASAMEHAGHSVKLVEGVATNIKVTSPEDQRLAEFLLSNP